jgi:hypothetical protein
VDGRWRFGCRLKASRFRTTLASSDFGALGMAAANAAARALRLTAEQRPDLYEQFLACR